MGKDGACPHLNTVTKVTIKRESRRVWDDVRRKYVNINMTIAKTVVRCSDCKRIVSQSEHVTGE